MNILGVRIDENDLVSALREVRGFLTGRQGKMIFTPNPEMLVDARKDEYFKKVLNSGDLNICDGRGVELAGQGRLRRIAGVDFMMEICALSAQDSQSVYLLGSKSDKILAKTKAELKTRFPGLSVVGYDRGPVFKNNIGRLKDDFAKTINKINMVRPNILFVAFGHGKQEKWIYQNLAGLPSVKIAMGVGGAFDYVSGHVRRAPAWMRRMGLEWLFRLILQPWRIGRIFKAGVIFPFYLKTK
ncbi:MAG: glycosyltransferase [Candidatus Magasanikbacteria bacterium CG10_big_fil_rev_8_21_14_0_10_40_10]|uniref:Glycosyltransferase n=1 Tax=Candidatus Magasanikbacteria bacterium CG10_big_fil_rev_8_21_14_0_10_40_10 TaxID=1974648 RepID=A0A2M6W4Q3_9BACT|nr:MAG: glycosyltransferase [Candidatus Magasanikbacteria bacterium CG10_big_fil_rev_8_21_14_0_10_40_10]